MNFELSDEHQAFRDMARKWVDKEAPKSWARQLEKDEHRYPFELWDKFTEAGFHGIGIDERYGGQGGDLITQMILARELARSLGGLAWICGITSFAGAKSIGVYGSDVQKEKFLPEIAAGKLRAAIALTLGASGGMSYRKEDWAKLLAKQAGGFDVVIDGAPAGALMQYSRRLNMGARVVIYGSTGGVDAQFSAPDLFLRHASVFGTAMGTLEDFRSLLGFVEHHRIQPVIDKRFTLEAARDAISALGHDHGMGKITVII